MSTGCYNRTVGKMSTQNEGGEIKLTNTELLRSKIVSSGLKIKFIADALGITPQGLHKKIENKSEFRASEIVDLCNILKINGKDRDAIFFCR